jgi:hypothetical protein
VEAAILISRNGLHFSIGIRKLRLESLRCGCRTPNKSDVSRVKLRGTQEY